MAAPEVESARGVEFKRIGEKQIRDALNSGIGIADEPKKQAAFRWLGDEAEEGRLREEKTHHYVRWTFFAAIAAVIVGLIGVGSTLLPLSTSASHPTPDMSLHRTNRRDGANQRHRQSVIRSPRRRARENSTAV